MKKTLNPTESSIAWKGKKITGSHHGTINIKEGHLEMENEKLTGGKIEIDMDTLHVTDLSGENKDKLEGHLKSEDFFGVENHPTASLIFTNVTKNEGKNEEGYSVEGDLSIKESTHPIKFNMVIVGNTAESNLKIDRTKYGVRYGSGSFFDNLGDNTINDNFELDTTLKF